MEICGWIASEKTFKNLGNNAVVCEFCNNLIKKYKNSNSRFCSPTCRDKAKYERNKNKEKPLCNAPVDPNCAYKAAYSGGGLCSTHYKRKMGYIPGGFEIPVKDSKYVSKEIREIIRMGDLAYIPIFSKIDHNWAVCDWIDVGLIKDHNWYLHDNQYARNSDKILMHKLILPQFTIVDHKNRDGLDNRRINLRNGKGSLNRVNTGKRKNTSSQYIGVSWNKNSQKWRATITVSGRHHQIGMFYSEHEAALAYNSFAEEAWGEYASLNIISENNQLN